MATIQTVRPTGTVYFGSLGGSAPTAADLSDNNDNTRAQFFQEFQGEQSYIYAKVAAFNPGTQRVAGVRARARIRMPVSSSASALLVRLTPSGSGQEIASTTNVAGNAWQEIATAYKANDFNGVEWGATALADVWVQADATSSMSGSAAWEVSELYADLDVRTKPTVSITSPTAGQKVASQQPTIYWNYNNQGDTVARHHVKVFTAATVAAPGFDPTTSATVYDSSATPGAASNKQVTTVLTPGASYYAYVRIATDFKGTDWWSDWSSVQFLVSQLPVVTNVATNPATPITTTNQPNITGTYTDPDGEAAEWLNIKVFSQAVYEAVGFDPNTATPTWNGTVAVTTASGATFSVQVGTALSPNVSYKAWVRASEVGAGQRWGNWASSTVAFLIQTAPGLMYDVPGTPTLSATADQGNQRVILALEARDNLLTRNQSTLDTGVLGWEVTTGSSTLLRDTTNFFQGGGALQWTATAASSSVRTVGTQIIPVLPNKMYSFGGRVRAPVAGRNARVRAEWLTSAGATIGSIVNGTSTALTSGQFTPLTTLQTTSPATAAFVRLIFEVTNAVAAEVYRADNPFIRPGAVTDWTRGGFATEAGRVSDTFQRADSAVSLGTAVAGGAWTAHKGTWGISSNQAYLAAGTNGHIDHVATLNSDFLSDGFVEADVKLSSARASAGLVFRALNNTSMFLVRLTKTATPAVDTLELSRYTGGTWTALATVAGGFVLGQTYKVRIEFYGGQIYVYLNGVLKISYLMLAGDLTTFGGYGRYGILSSFHATDAAYDDGGTRWDNFVAGAPATQTVTVERSFDSGATWDVLRGAEKITLNQQAGVVYDYEVPLYVIPQYRMRAFGTEVTEFASAYSAVAPLNQQLVATSWWLKDPSDPSLNTAVKVMPPFSFSRKEPQQIYEPLGRKTSVVVTDGPRGITGTLNLMTRSQEEYDRLNHLIDNGRPLLLVDVFGRSWYIKFGESHDWTMLTAVPTDEEVYPVRHLHTVSLPFVEVSAP